EHDAIARRRRPQMVALGRVEPVHVAGPAAVKELLIIVQVEGIEIQALALADLFNAQHLAAADRNCLPCRGFEYILLNLCTLGHLRSLRPDISLSPGASFWQTPGSPRG